MATGALSVLPGETSGAEFQSRFWMARRRGARLNPDLPPKLENHQQNVGEDFDLALSDASDICTDLQRLRRDSESSRSVIPSPELKSEENPEPFKAREGSSSVGRKFARRVPRPFIIAAVGALICIAGYTIASRYRQTRIASPVPLNVVFSKLTLQPGVDGFRVSRPTESGWCIRVATVEVTRFICRASAGRLPSISVAIQR